LFVWFHDRSRARAEPVERATTRRVMGDRLPTADEQAFLVRLADLLVGRRGFGVSFELDGPRLRVFVHPPYAAPAHVVVRVDDERGYRVRTEGGRLTTVHDVAARLIYRVRVGLG
jgi:hypothetical protein